MSACCALPISSSQKLCFTMAEYPNLRKRQDNN